MNTSLTGALREARITAGFSQRALAEQLEVTPSHVSRIEAGERQTTPAQVEKWLHLCGYVVDVVAVGRSSRASEVARALSNADDEALGIIVRLLVVWPSLTSRDRRLIEAEIAVYEAEHRGR